MKFKKESNTIEGFQHHETVSIGLIADTHMPGTIANLWPGVYAAFQGVDCILHAGDLHVAGVIDELEQIAPTYVAEGNGDVDVVHPRLAETWLGDFGGHTIGMVHRFPTPRRASPEKLAKKASQFFVGDHPAIIIYGHTHLAELHEVESCLYINPGSATLPNNQSTRLGTIGRLDISAREVRVVLSQLTDSGLETVGSWVVAKIKKCVDARTD